MDTLSSIALVVIGLAVIVYSWDRLRARRASKRSFEFKWYTEDSAEIEGERKRKRTR